MGGAIPVINVDIIRLDRRAEWTVNDHWSPWSSKNPTVHKFSFWREITLCQVLYS